MNTQLSQPTTPERSQTAEDWLEIPDTLGRSVEPARIPDAKGWTVEETMRMVGELRAKWLRNLHLAQRGQYQDQPVTPQTAPVRQESSSASNLVTNMNSTMTPMELKSANEEITRLQKELVEARVRAEVASERLDRAEHRLEGASTLIGCLRARILELELETDRLEWQSDKSEKLRRQAEELNLSLNEKLQTALIRINELESSWWHKFKTWFLSLQSVGAQLDGPSGRAYQTDPLRI